MRGDIVVAMDVFDIALLHAFQLRSTYFSSTPDRGSGPSSLVKKKKNLKRSQTPVF